MSQGQRVKFLGTTFQTITAWGTANAFTGISNASPAVVTDVAHGLLTGDVVKIADVVGMTEANGQVAVVQKLTDDTYSLIGVDSLNWGVYASGGTASKATFSGSCEVTGYDGNSGTTPEITTETNCGKGIDVGLPDPGSVTLSYSKAPTEFQNALEAARVSTDTTALKTTLPSGKGIMIDIGFITQTNAAGSAGGVWTGGASLRRQVNRVDLAAA